MINPNKISVTNHALERFRKRFVLAFPRSVWLDQRITINFIKAQISTATECNNWRACPFYVNSIGTRYGKNTRVFKKSGVYYVCGEERGRLVVRTAVKRWFTMD